MEIVIKETGAVSIPLEQGRVFRLLMVMLMDKLLRLNPFRTGQGLSTYAGKPVDKAVSSLNPFRTGQGLSTYNEDGSLKQDEPVSIPLEQGRVFRRLY